MTETKTDSSLDMIRRSFSEGLEEGRGLFLRKLLKEKWIEVADIQKLYSSGLLEPNILEDITLGDLVKLTGLRIDLARKIKDMILNKDSNLPPEYEKKEVDKVKKETQEIHAQIEKEKIEFETLKKEHHSLLSQLKEALAEKQNHTDSIGSLEEKEKDCYLQEKRLQNEVLFMLKEGKQVNEEVQVVKTDLIGSEKKLEKVKNEFLFTKGECTHLLEKIDYLVARLDKALLAKDVSGQKVALFLQELKRVHDRLSNTNKKTQMTYYVNKNAGHG